MDKQTDFFPHTLIVCGTLMIISAAWGSFIRESNQVCPKCQKACEVVSADVSTPGD